MKKKNISFFLFMIIVVLLSMIGFFTFSKISLLYLLSISLIPLIIYLIRNVRANLLLFTFLLPLEGLGALVNLSFVSPIRLLGLFLLISYLGSILKKKKLRLNLESTFILCLIISYFLLQFLFVLNKESFINELSTILQLIIIVKIFVDVIEATFLPKIFAAMVLGNTLNSIYAIYQSFTGKKLLIEYFTSAATSKTFYAGDLYRATGTFIDPNYFALSILIALPLNIFLINLYNKKMKIFFTIVFFINSLAILLTFSKMAIGIYLLFAVYLILKNSIRKKFMLNFLIIIVSLLVFNVLIDNILNRLNVNELTNGRSIIWQTYLFNIEGLTLFTGIGLGNFPIYIKQFLGYSADSHNLYIKILAEIGIIGMILIIIFFRSIFNNFSIIKNIYLLESIVIFALCSFFLSPLLSKQIWIIFSFLLVSNSDFRNKTEV